MKKLAVLIAVLCLLTGMAAAAAADTLKLSLVGDCTMGGRLFSRVEKEKGLAHFFSGLVDVFSRDDLTVANCEGSLTNRTRNAGHEFNLSGPPEYAQAFTLGSVEAVNIANNHTYDFYKAGRQDTVEALEKEGIGWFGEGDLYITEVKGVKIGMTGYTYPHRYDLTRQERDIGILREKGCDLVIVSMHWGKETSPDANREQLALGPQLIDLGADIVFGHGPHVLQPIQIYKGKPIFYSLANFSFGANVSPTDPDTAAISLEYEIGDRGLSMTRLTAIPCRMHNNKDFRPYEVTEQSQREKIFKKLVFAKSDLPESFLTTGTATFEAEEPDDAAFVPAGVPDTPYVFECMVNVHCALRKEPSESAKRIGGVDKGSHLKVLTYTDDWCLCRYDGKEGYLKTEWLYHFRSMKPFDYTKPGFVRSAGYGKVLGETAVSAEGYSGNVLKAGDVVVLESYSPLLSEAAVHRSVCTLNGQNFEFTPFVPWDGAREGDVIGGHTNYYNEESGGRLAANRAYNIRKAAELLDGLIIKPGETFSFNKICAPYRRSNGYREAPAISSSQATSYGGGVCQVSTAMYQALLHTPLYIDEWTVHRDIGVQYAHRDYDCAVGEYFDLRVVNTLPYPVELSVKDQKGVVTVLLIAGEGAAPLYGVMD